MEDLTDRQVRELIHDIADGDSLEERYAARDELLRLSETAQGDDLFDSLGIDREELREDDQLRESHKGPPVRLRPSNGDFAGTPGIALREQMVFGGASLKGLIESGALDPQAWASDPELREHYRDQDLLADMGIDRDLLRG